MKDREVDPPLLKFVRKLREKIFEPSECNPVCQAVNERRPLRARLKGYRKRLGDFIDYSTRPNHIELP